MYSLFVVILEGCGYSQKAKNKLDALKIKYNKLKVPYEEKEKYKTDEIQTYPQIYLKKNNKDTLLLGGYTELEEFLNLFKNHTYNENKVSNYKNNYSIWNKKSILRLIEIINS